MRSPSSNASKPFCTSACAGRAMSGRPPPPGCSSSGGAAARLAAGTSLADAQYRFLFEPPPPNEWVALDCETTGLNPRSDEIISIGAVRIVGERILTSERLELLVRPEKGVSADSVRMHRLREQRRGGRLAAAARRCTACCTSLAAGRWWATTWSLTWPCSTAPLAAAGHRAAAAQDRGVGPVLRPQIPATAALAPAGQRRHRSALCHAHGRFRPAHSATRTTR
jgi:hypothetical protein